MTTMTEISSSLGLPRVKKEELLVYDIDRDILCGYLSKKAGKSSTFSKGKWQKRWFVINVDVGIDENYSLSYYHHPDDKEPRQTLDLSNSKVVLSGGNNFSINFDEDYSLTLGADTKDILERWVDALQKVITVANLRDRMISTKRPDTIRSPESFRGNQIQGHNNFHPANNNNTNNPELNNNNINNTDNIPLNNNNNPQYRIPQKLIPTLRLDIDINTIPPGSTQRRQFVEMFASDISRVLQTDPEMIEVVSVKPYPGMIWLTLVEFEVYVPPPVLTDIDHRKYQNLDEDEQSELLEEEARRLRRKLLLRLNEMVADVKSPLYSSGFVTCRLDSTFSKHLIEIDENNYLNYANNFNNNIEIYSPDDVVLEIMNRYKDVDISPSINANQIFTDITHFRIFLSFENTVRPFSVPNPLVLTRRDCAIWPYEIKQALGLTGNMQELWIEPLALVPRDVPKYMSEPIVFEPSARLQGAVTINAAKLKADLCYEVQCEDYRGDVLRTLSDEEVDKIKETFDSYDQNNDGAISKFEMENLIKQRTEIKKEIIESKFQEIMTGDPTVLSALDVKRAEEYKKQYLQRLEEAEFAMIKMFNAADVNGDGLVSFTEFMIAEAWWLKCTLNPEKMHLF